MLRNEGKLTWFPATFSAARQERKLVKTEQQQGPQQTSFQHLQQLVERSSGDYGTAHEMTA